MLFFFLLYFASLFLKMSGAMMSTNLLSFAARTASLAYGQENTRRCLFFIGHSLARNRFRRPVWQTQSDSKISHGDERQLCRAGTRARRDRQPCSTGCVGILFQLVRL